MTKVTIQTPTEKILLQTSKKIKNEIIDPQGRVIKLRVPDVLDEFDLTSALGEHSTNMGVVAMASSLLYVESIDNDLFPMPKTYEQVRAGIKRIGRDGMKAIMVAIQEYVQTEGDSTEEQLHTIKKS